MHAVVNLAVAGCSDGDPVVREVDNFAAPVPFPAGGTGPGTGDGGVPGPDVDVIHAPCAPPEVDDAERMVFTTCFCDHQGWCAEAVPYAGGALTDVTETNTGDLWLVVDRHLYARRAGEWARAVFAEAGEVPIAVESWGDTVWVATKKTIYRIQDNDIGYAAEEPTPTRTIAVDAETGLVWWGDGVRVGTLDGLSSETRSTEAGYVLWVAPTGEVFARDAENLKRRSLDGTWESLLSVIGNSPDTKFAGWSADNFWFVDRWWRDGEVVDVSRPGQFGEDFGVATSTWHHGSAAMVSGDEVFVLDDATGQLSSVSPDGRGRDAPDQGGPTYRVRRDGGRVYAAGVLGGLWRYDAGAWEEQLPRTCTRYGVADQGRMFSLKHEWEIYGRSFSAHPERVGCTAVPGDMPLRFELSTIGGDGLMVTRRQGMRVLHGPGALQPVAVPLPPGEPTSGVYGQSTEDMWVGSTTGELMHHRDGAWEVVPTVEPGGLIPLTTGQDGRVAALTARASVHWAPHELGSFVILVGDGHGEKFPLGFRAASFADLGDGRAVIAGRTSDAHLVWTVVTTDGYMRPLGEIGTPDSLDNVTGVAHARDRIWFVTSVGVWSAPDTADAEAQLEVPLDGMTHICALPAGHLVVLGSEEGRLLSPKGQVVSTFEVPGYVVEVRGAVAAGEWVAVKGGERYHRDDLIWFDPQQDRWFRDPANTPRIDALVRGQEDELLGLVAGPWGGAEHGVWSWRNDAWHEVEVPPDWVGTVSDAAADASGRMVFAVDGPNGAWLDFLEPDGSWTRETLIPGPPYLWRRVHFDAQGALWMLTVDTTSTLNGVLSRRVGPESWVVVEQPPGMRLSMLADFRVASDGSWWAVVEGAGLVHERRGDGWLTWPSLWPDGPGQFAAETVLAPGGDAWSTRVGGPDAGWRLNLARAGCVREFQAPLGGHPEFVGIDGDRLIGISARGQVTWAALANHYACPEAQ